MYSLGRLEAKFIENWDGNYNPELGRFLTVDPIGFEAGDVNFYRYVFGNPIFLIDPSGRNAIIKLLKDVTDNALSDQLKKRLGLGNEINRDKYGKPVTLKDYRNEPNIIDQIKAKRLEDLFAMEQRELVFPQGSGVLAPRKNSMEFFFGKTIIIPCRK